MSDICDKADEEAEFLLDLQIEAARSAPGDLKGEKLCKVCGEPNDRRWDGYAVCTDCMGTDNVNEAVQKALSQASTGDDNEKD